MSEMDDIGQAPPPPPQEMGTGGEMGAVPGTGAYGGLGKRFLARIIDGLIVGVPVGIILAVIPGIAMSGIIGSAVSAIAGFAYFVLLETSNGATLGKQVLGLRVVGESGAAPVATEASARRNAWMLIGILSGIPVVGFLASLASLGIVIAIAVTLNGDARKQGVHDKFGGTLVLDR